MAMRCRIRWQSSALFFLLFVICAADAYDPSDPFGNITIKWDFIDGDPEVPTIWVSIYNYQLYRHMANPGWSLSWTWPGEQYIWAITGAEATTQGNCSRFRGQTLPHCCEQSPTVKDLIMGTVAYNKQVQNCCRSGELTSLVQDPSRSMSFFQMSIGGLDTNTTDENVARPFNFSIGHPGYTCSNATLVPPTKFQQDPQRTTSALLTWEVTCSYSQFRESPRPMCCVSLSTFYNSTIVSCPVCSCGCEGSPSTPQCAREGELPSLLELPSGDVDQTVPTSVCTNHMCPIKVHWHVKVSYKEYWRAKLTITNYNLYRNYSNWNLVLQHPNLKSLTQIFSFNSKPLIQYGDTNDTAMFWGIKYYNEMLLQNGNVQTEMLLHKDTGDFTFENGWAFPRRILFDGHECVMPAPDMYPALPEMSSSTSHFVHYWSSALLFSVVLLFF